MGVHYADDAALALYGAFACDDSLVQTCLFTQRAYLLLIIGEIYWVKACHTLVVLNKAAAVGGYGKAVCGVHSAVISAGGAYPHILFKLIVIA